MMALVHDLEGLSLSESTRSGRWLRQVGNGTRPRKRRNMHGSGSHRGWTPPWDSRRPSPAFRPSKQCGVMLRFAAARREGTTEVDGDLPEGTDIYSA
jgi:hypothetical protein